MHKPKKAMKAMKGSRGNGSKMASAIAGSDRINKGAGRAARLNRISNAKVPSRKE